tara:strand:- start:13377 stop:14723 length:1347 start_codon:yes stop_codon:yes gene_type:complete
MAEACVPRVDRDVVIKAYRQNRVVTKRLFDLVDPDAYYERPISLRNPIVFYEGHIPAFSVNCFLKKGLGHPGINKDFEFLFARGIDPKDQRDAANSDVQEWPDRKTVKGYAALADEAILDALRHAVVEGDSNPVLHRGQGVFTMLEHEIMHQETLLYMWHRLPFESKRQPDKLRPFTNGVVPERRMVHIPEGTATLGSDRDAIEFGWDNEFPLSTVDRVASFFIDMHNVTNQDYLEFVEFGGYRKAELWTKEGWKHRQALNYEHPLFWELHDGRWMWRGMFEMIDLPMAWPVFVTHDEALAYARWKDLRLPTEAEFHRAAYGTPAGNENLYPWGDVAPDKNHGNFDFLSWDPVPVGTFPEGASAWGVHDLVGNGWEWTSTVFRGFDGFTQMASYPEYSADFFDEDHFVVKGASPVTGRRLVRRSFRNWFRPHYPYMYASFRCAKTASG